MSTFDRKEFGRRLQAQRRAAGFTRQQDLADAIDVSVQAINFYESGMRIPDAEILSRISQALCCTSDFLLQLETAAKRENADIQNQTGLSEKSISVLREYKNVDEKEFPESYFSDEILDSSSGIGLINCILEHENVDTFFRYFSDIYCALYAERYYVKVEDDTMSALKQRVIRNGYTIVSPEEAIYLIVRQLDDLLSKAIIESITKRLRK